MPRAAGALRSRPHGRLRGWAEVQPRQRCGQPPEYMLPPLRVSLSMLGWPGWPGLRPRATRALAGCGHARQ